MNTWKINGAEFELDVQDADTMERYENAFAKMSKEEHEVPKVGKQSEIIKAHCRLYKRLFNRIFGENASEKIFGNKPENIAVYDDVYFSFLDFVREQMIESARIRAEKLMKYRPKK